MPRLPLVAIIGRPNTGKSTLFNKIVGKRRAIVSDVPGTTRDHVAQRIQTEQVEYLLLDTGGMGGGTDDKDFEKDVHAQSLLAIDAADVIVFTVNSREEITRSDRDIATILRKTKKKHVPVILAVTKCDDPGTAAAATTEFQELGIADVVVAVSAFHGLGMPELEAVISAQLKKLHFGKVDAEKTDRKTPRIAVVGKPNVGKSSFVNALMSETQRKTSPKLVSPVAGTTRDATDTIIRHEGTDFLFVDTAGLKRHASALEGVEYYATLRSIHAIEEADVAVLILDATETVSRQDQRIASVAVDAGVGLILVLNKCDLLDAEQKKAKRIEIARDFQFCKYAPVVLVSAKSKQGLLKIFDVFTMVHANRLRRVPVRELHRWFSHAAANQPLGATGTAKHLTQAEDPPPTFVLFVKNPKEVHVSQLRHLDNRLRETFGFEGTPIRWVTKSSNRRN